ncbi:hypothetical protein V8J88_16085 [Massilia sp. W12]|uniref:hypothetical protein n=1 Tax=Massilia sp. W12 TaxID=3126507 RepID=UPI0030D33F12
MADANSGSSWKAQPSRFVPGGGLHACHLRVISMLHPILILQMLMPNPKFYAANDFNIAFAKQVLAMF